MAVRTTGPKILLDLADKCETSEWARMAGGQKILKGGDEPVTGYMGENGQRTADPHRVE